MKINKEWKWFMSTFNKLNLYIVNNFNKFIFIYSLCNLINKL